MNANLGSGERSRLGCSGRRPRRPEVLTADDTDFTDGQSNRQSTLMNANLGSGGAQPARTTIS